MTMCAVSPPSVSGCFTIDYDRRFRVAMQRRSSLGPRPDSDEAWAAAKEQGNSSVRWRRYGIESRVCLLLHHAASLSVRYGSAISFG